MRNAREKHADAEAPRAYLAHIESLPIGRAVQFIRDTPSSSPRVEVNQAAADHSHRLHVSTGRRIEQTDPSLEPRHVA